MSPRTRVPCRGCGTTTNGRWQVCRDCRDDIPLRDGAWVLSSRRVLVWEPTKRRTA